MDQGGMRMGSGREFHNEGLHNLYFAPNVVSMTKCRTLVWTGHVALWEKISVV